MKKAPPLPKNAKDFLVTAAPWFAVLAVVLGLPAILAVTVLSLYLLYQIKSNFNK